MPLLSCTLKEWFHSDAYSTGIYSRLALQIPGFLTFCQENREYIPYL